MGITWKPQLWNQQLFLKGKQMSQTEYCDVGRKCSPYPIWSKLSCCMHLSFLQPCITLVRFPEPMSYNLCHGLPSQKSLYSSLSSVPWKVHALLDTPCTVSGFLLLGCFSAIDWPLLPFNGTLSYTENFSQPSLTCLTSQNKSARLETRHLLHGPPHHFYLSVKSSPQ